jgi:hypothetical protein
MLNFRLGQNDMHQKIRIMVYILQLTLVFPALPKPIDIPGPVPWVAPAVITSKLYIPDRDSTSFIKARVLSQLARMTNCCAYEEIPELWDLFAFLRGKII